MPKLYPQEFRDDVVAIARKGEAPLTQIAKDFGIWESCLANWLTKADVEDGNRLGVTEKQSAEVRELKKRNRLLEQWCFYPVVKQLRLGCFLAFGNACGL